MRPPHTTVQDAIYFLTTHCAKGLHPFQNRKACEAFLSVLREKQQTFNLRIYAFVIMPNHTHLLLQMAGETSISKLMNHINGSSARRINAVLPERQQKIWQGGFYDVIVRTSKEFALKVNYIHRNPVQWNLVGRPEEYEFSSAHFFSRTFGNPLLPGHEFDDFGLMGFLHSVNSVI
ncbi:MAG TPA: transposase [Bacteroidota bacterium]